MDVEAVLRLFLKFIGWRIETENLDVLRQIVADFHDDPPSFTRVEEMVYRVFPLIAILPRDQADENLRAKATALLQRMRDREDIVTGSEGGFRDLRMALESHVWLKNWNILERVYSDFLVGSERTVREFISLQPEAIVVIPTVPRGTAGLRYSREERAIEPMKRTIQEPMKWATHTLEVHDIDSKRQRTRLEHSTPALPVMKQEELNGDIIGSIRAELDEVASKVPWKEAFNLSTLEYPFDMTKHPELATALDLFWRRYARTVWERNFWVKESPDMKNEKCKLQRNRQRNAAKSFVTTVIVPIFDIFGAQFFCGFRRTAKSPLKMVVP